MKITLFQQDIVWADVAANQKLAEDAINRVVEQEAQQNQPATDLFVLPEMWSTGFATQPDGVAESDCSSLRWMQQMANRLNAAGAGSIATEDDGKFYNRFYFVTPMQSAEGAVFASYDKHHLFTYGGEHHRYTAGEDRVVVEWQGVRLLLQVCYDLRFPVFSRNRDDYDVALYVASWPVPRRSAWDALLIARAIENQCYVCGVNRVGSDPACKYNGGTVAIDPYGKVIAACADDEVGAITFEVDMPSLMAFREKFPVLNDRD